MEDMETKMTLRFRNLGFAISAIYLVLFLAVVSVAAQDAGDITRLEPAVPAAQTAQGSSEKWEVVVAPYLWLAGIKGTVGVGSFTTDIDPGFSDILNSLNFGFMGSLEARKGKFILATDLMYLNVEQTKSTGGTLFSSLNVNTKTIMLSQVTGYRLLSREGGSLDAIVGIRFWHTSTRLEAAPALLAGRVAETSKNWADAIGGLRGYKRLSRKFSVLGRGDFGGGGSDFTYRLFGGVGFDVSRKTTLIAGYRTQYVKYTRGNSLFDGSIKGILLGASFRF